MLRQPWVVRARASAVPAYGWQYDKDYILLLSEFDMGQHQAEQFAGVAGGYNPVNYQPQYWFINGLSFPNTSARRYRL